MLIKFSSMIGAGVNDKLNRLLNQAANRLASFGEVHYSPESSATDAVWFKRQFA